MKFCVLASGSKGNMTYIEAGNTRLLIDCGISIRNAIKKTDIDFSLVTDILITHEHGDHIKFLDTVLKFTNANLYISKKSFNNLKEDLVKKISQYKVRFIEAESKYKIGDFEVLTLALSHDASNIFGFVLIHDNKKIGYMTDTGIFPVRYKSLISELDALIIEANHNVEMLVNSDRDMFLINRILSIKGHLSNKACYDLLKETICDYNKYVILAHVSEDCNCDDCLYEEIINKIKSKFKGEILIARQNEALKLIEL